MVDVLTRASVTRRLLAFVIGWDLPDVVLDVAAGEVEVLRVTSNRRSGTLQPRRYRFDWGDRARRR